MISLIQKAREIASGLQKQQPTIGNIAQKVIQASPVAPAFNAYKTLQSLKQSTGQTPLKQAVLNGVRPIVSDAYNTVEKLYQKPKALSIYLNAGTPFSEAKQAIQSTRAKLADSVLGKAGSWYSENVFKQTPLYKMSDAQGKLMRGEITRDEYIKASSEEGTNLMAGLVTPTKKLNYTPIDLQKYGITKANPVQQLRQLIRPAVTKTGSTIRRRGEMILNRLNDPTIIKPVSKSETTMFFKNSLQEWRNALLAGKQKADQVVQRFSAIPEKEGLNAIKYIENPTVESASRLKFNAKKYGGVIADLRSYYDAIREEGVAKGLNIGYLKNYLNHVYKESPQKIYEYIEQKIKGGGKIPSFVKERRIPSYAEALQIVDTEGKRIFTPKFTHPAQLAAHYRMQLDKAMANQKLLDTLTRSSLIQTIDDAPIGWKPVSAPFVPDLNGKFAPPKIAETLNTLFGQAPDNMATQVTDLTAKASKYMQEVSLSGGIKTLNAFSLGNIIKEFTAGRLISPVQAFVRSFSDDASKAYFNTNKKALEGMAREGIPVATNLDYNSAYKNLFESQSARKVFGNTWNAWVNAPTFRRFLPMLQVEFYKDALKSGMSKKQAGEAVKNFYGVVDNFTRSKFAEDTISSIFFAPKFRESMINFWINNAKALNPAQLANPALNANRRFLAGTIMTYLTYSALNKKLTGRWMHENKDGKEFSIEIPQGKGRSWFIPMLPSIGTVPRRILEALAALKGGDIAGAVQKGGSFLSQPASLLSQLGTNRSFYGAPIYDQEDPALTKLGKLGGYALEQSSHPFIGEPIAVMQGRKTPLEAGLGMLEMPVYPSRSTEQAHLSGSAFKKYKVLNELNPQKAKEYSDLRLGEQHKPEAIEYLLSGKKEKAKELVKKYEIEITNKEIKKATTEKVMALVFEGKKDEAKQLQKEMEKKGIYILNKDVKALAKKRAIDLILSGNRQEARELQKKYGFVIYEKELNGK